MSLFIHHENQEMLWNMINKTGLFIQVFGSDSPQSQDWFRNIIQDIYNQVQSKMLTLVDLKVLNKNVISAMIQSLKLKVPPVTYMNQPYIVESKEEKSTRQFQERQNDYEKMLIKPVPKQVDFGDSVKDEAISNMDELIKEHMKQREEELQIIPSPPASYQLKQSTQEITVKEASVDIREQVLQLTKRIEELEARMDTLTKNNIS